MKIKFTKSMIFDAICTCNFLAGEKANLHPTQKEVIDILMPLAEGKIADGIMSYSSLCLIISEYLPDPASATLDDLHRMFSSITDVDTVVRPKIKGEFVQHYIYWTLDMLKGGGADKYCKHIDVLKEIGFEEVWCKYIEPVENTRIEKLEDEFSHYNIDGVLNMISNLKCNTVDDVKIYISLMSYPVAFSLSESSFLDTVGGGNGSIRIIAHELMHGFASGELIEEYKKFVNSSLYLKSTHDFLLDQMKSGNEEEFVMAAEHYIMYKCGIMTKEEIVLENYSTYCGCVPLALYIFEYLTRENGIIGNYDRWLVDKFKSGVFKTDDIFRVVDGMLPPPNSADAFYANLFTRFQRSAFIIRWSQINRKSDIKEGIERITESEFVINNDRNLVFGTGKAVLDSHIKRETLISGNMTIERIEFDNKKDALSLKFPYGGSNVGPIAVEYQGQSFANSYCLNLDYPKGEPIRAEFYFVCNNAKYIITSGCDDDVTELEGENCEERTFQEYGNEIMKAVLKAVDIVMLLNEQDI